MKRETLTRRVLPSPSFSPIRPATGLSFFEPEGINVVPDGDILLVNHDISESVVLRVDAHSGDRTIVSSSTVGTGPVGA